MATTTMPKNHLGLSEAEFQRFSRACHATWQYIAADIMTAVSEDGGDSIPRADVMELVLDAGRILYHGETFVPMRRYGKDSKALPKTEWERFYEERLNPWIKAHYNTPQFKRIIKEVFPYDTYE